MTFDFAPDWISDTAAYGHSSVRPVTMAASAILPAPSSNAETAALVQELFAEGALSYEQLRNLSAVPELGPLLNRTIAEAHPIRRIAR